jgi:hypothetical protein
MARRFFYLSPKMPSNKGSNRQGIHIKNTKNRTSEKSLCFPGPKYKGTKLAKSGMAE